MYEQPTNIIPVAIVDIIIMNPIKFSSSVFVYVDLISGGEFGKIIPWTVTDDTGGEYGDETNDTGGMTREEEKFENFSILV